MNKEQYLQMRNALIGEVESLITEGKIEESESKMQEVKDLDNKWEGIKLANANLNALKDNNNVLNLENQSVSLEGGKTLDNVQQAKVVDEQEIYKNAWAKEMMGKQLDVNEKAVFDKINTQFQNITQTTNDHAVVIPETVTQNIWKEAADLYPILGDFRATYVPGDLTMLKETDSGNNASFYDEPTEVAEDTMAIGELNLTGCELAKDITVSWKLRKMSIDQFIPYITTLLAEKMGAGLAAAVVNGKGKPGAGDTFKPEPKGIVTTLLAEAGTPQIVTYDPDNVTTPVPLTYDIVAKAMGKIKSAYKAGASVYAKSDVIWNRLALIKDEMGRPIFIPDVTAGGVGRLFGIVVKEDDSIPVGGILIGNVGRGYAINFNEVMTIYTEDHVKLRKTDYMGYSIVDGDVMTTKAFTYIQDIPTA